MITPYDNIHTADDLRAHAAGRNAPEPPVQYYAGLRGPSVRITGSAGQLMATFRRDAPGAVSVRYSGPTGALSRIDWDALEQETRAAVARQEASR